MGERGQLYRPHMIELGASDIITEGLLQHVSTYRHGHAEKVSLAHGACKVFRQPGIDASPVKVCAVRAGQCPLLVSRGKIIQADSAIVRLLGIRCHLRQ